VPLDVTAADPTGKALHANTTGQVYLVTGDGTVTGLGAVAFDAAQHGSVTLPETLAAGTAFRLAVSFDDTPLMWDAATVRSPATAPAAPAAPTVAVSDSSLQVTWKKPADGGSPITSYRVTLTRDGKAQPARTVVAGRTTTTFLQLKPGKYRATVVAVTMVGTSAPSAASAEARITSGPAVTLKVSVKSRCINGKIQIDVYVVNKSGHKVDLTVKTPYGTQKFTGVANGKSVHRLVNSGRKRIAAGKVTIDTTFAAGGVTYHSTYTARYAAAKCKTK
jgi:hypothetical protein